MVGVQADNGPHLRLLPSLGGCHAALNQRSGIKPHSPLSDRYKGAGLIVQVQASIIKSESCPGQDLWRVRQQESAADPTGSARAATCRETCTATQRAVTSAPMD